MLEIYNEQIRDLLDPNGKPGLKVTRAALRLLLLDVLALSAFAFRAQT